MKTQTAQHLLGEGGAGRWSEEKQATWEGQGNIFKNYILQKPKLKGQRQEIIEDHQDKLDWSRLLSDLGRP